MSSTDDGSEFKFLNFMDYVLPITILIIIIWGTYWFFQPPPPEKAGFLLKTEEQVMIRRGDSSLSPEKLNKDEKNRSILFVGDRIVTAERAEAVVKIPDRAKFRIAERGSVKITQAVKGVTLNVKHGDIYNSVKDDVPYKLRTPNAVAGVRGTFFMARVKEGWTSIRVLEGKVDVGPSENPDESVSLESNYQLVVSSSKSIDESPVPLAGFQRSNLEKNYDRLQGSETQSDQDSEMSPDRVSPDKQDAEQTDTPSEQQEGDTTQRKQSGDKATEESQDNTRSNQATDESSVEESKPSTININTASYQKLLDDPVLFDVAQQIVAYRIEKPFESKAQILHLYGISKDTYRKIRDRITVGDQMVNQSRDQRLIKSLPKININEAEQSELSSHFQEVAGLSSKRARNMARKIVQYRDDHGSFQNLDELLLIDEEGQRNEFRGYLTVRPFLSVE